MKSQARRRRHRRLASSSTPRSEQVEAAKRIGAAVCEVHTGPYAHAFHSKGRDAESPAVVAELEKIQAAGEAIRALGMRFNAGHALNYFNVEPVARLPGVRELHIGHAIVSRARCSSACARRCAR